MTAVDTITSAMDLEPRILKQTKPIVVATDGSDAALAAIRFADLIRSRTGCGVRVVSTLEPLPVVIPQEGTAFRVDWDKAREKGRHDIILQQLTELGIGSEWPLDISFGSPSEAIASYARSHNAGLIVVGSNKHGFFDRMLGEDTAADIARISDIPLLIVTPEMTRLPKRIIVALGLHPDGMQNIAQTISLVSDAQSVTCAHVQADDEYLRGSSADYDREYRFAADERFASIQKDLSAAGLKAHLVSLHGDPAKEVTEFSERAAAELIAVGVNRRPGKTKAIGGKNLRRILRHAGCSVLIVPSLLPTPAGAKLPGATEVITDSRAWDSTLREFTRRNAGRIGSLEVDDPELGANMEASNYPLLGVDYDHRDECLTIILGDVHGTERHLTRTIFRPKSISILNGKVGDVALCVTHNGGQTLMTF